MEKNGIGIVLREELAESVLEVKRVSERLMAMQVNGSILNIVSAYASQVNYSMEEKNNFWEDLDGLIESISKEERIVLGADLNGHVGEGNIGDEEIMGRLFADDIVICEETRQEVEQRLESWKYALERKGMKVSRSKTEYFCVNGRNDNGTVKMEDTKVPRVKEFKYLRSTVQENGGCEREVKKRVQAGWNGWRRVSGVICDKRLPARVKEKVYSSVVRPAMVYGLETVAVTKKQVEEMEVAEMKMLRFTMGVTRKDKIRNEHIRSTVKVERLGIKMREGRLRWYGDVMRRDQEYVGKKMMEMELPGKRRRGRPKRKFLDVVKEDMKEVGVKEMDIEDRKMWRMMIRCNQP